MYIKIKKPDWLPLLVEEWLKPVWLRLDRGLGNT